MRWEKLRRSQNIENRRGQRMARRPAAVGGGCSIILLLVLALIFKVNPLEFLSEAGSNQVSKAPSTNQLLKVAK